MSEYDDLTSQIIDSIDYIVKERLRTAPFDKTRTGIITAVLGNNMYTVKIDNTEYDVLSLSDSTLPVNSIVKVLVPENNILVDKEAYKEEIQKASFDKE